MRRIEKYKIIAHSSFLDMELEVPKRQVTSTLRKINKLQSMFVKHLKNEFKLKHPPFSVWSHARHRREIRQPRLDVKSVEGYQGLRVEVISPAIN